MGNNLRDEEWLALISAFDIHRSPHKDWRGNVIFFSLELISTGVTNFGDPSSFRSHTRTCGIGCPLSPHEKLALWINAGSEPTSDSEQTGSQSGVATWRDSQRHSTAVEKGQAQSISLLDHRHREVGSRMTCIRHLQHLSSTWEGLHVVDVPIDV